MSILVTFGHLGTKKIFSPKKVVRGYYVDFGQIWSSQVTAVIAFQLLPGVVYSALQQLDKMA